MSTTSSSAVDLYARQLGWSVIPVNSDSKQPLVPWKKFSERRPTDDELRGWPERFKNAGIAVITGPVSGLVVLDCDGKSGLTEAVERGLPKTPMVSTPSGGMHAYFKWPKELKPFRNSTKLGESKKLDVRGDSAYVLAPWSKRSDGRRYTWLEDPKMKLAEVPGWFMKMLQKLTGEKRAEARRPTEYKVRLPGAAERVPRRVKRLIKNGYEDLERYGSRSECDLSVVVSLVFCGASNEEVKKIFESSPIGEKARERPGDSYLNFTIERAREQVARCQRALIKYADPIDYSQLEDGGSGAVRLQLAFWLEEESRLVRSGLTLPDQRHQECAHRWLSFFEAVRVRAPKSYEELVQTCHQLRRKFINVEFNEKRKNPIVGFFPTGGD